MSVETVLLKISGDSGSGEQALRRIGRALDNLGTALRQAQTQTSGSAKGLDTVARAAQSASKGGQEASGGLGGLLGLLAKLNPATIAATLGLAGLLKGLNAFKNEVIGVVANAQGLEISLESLAARELVRSGQFSNAAEAMGAAEVAAQGLLSQIQAIGLKSPYMTSLVTDAFKLAMGYGFASEQALSLTRANLDMAAGMNLTAQDMAEINRVFGQIRGVNKLLAQDLNQLRTRGIDLGDVLRSELGVSIAEFNAGLQSGRYSVNDLLDAFEQFAQTNFGGAAERMTKTITGVKSTLGELKEIALKQLFKPALDSLTAAAAEGLGWLSEIVTQSGALEKAGQRLVVWVDKAIGFGKAVVGFFTEAREAAQQATDGAGRFIGVFSLGAAGKELWTQFLGGVREVVANLREVGALVATYVAPAFQWLKRVVMESDFTPLVTHLKDAIATALSVLNGFILSIRNLLQGQGRDSFNPLHDALVNVLTWMALSWDRFLAGAVSWGWNLVVQIANGIYSAARSVLASALTYLGNAIGLFLKPGSPPKKGPLSHIVEWGQGVIDVFLQSFKTADFSTFQASLSPIKKALQDAVSVGNLSEPEFVQIYGQARELVAQLWATFRESGKISEDVLAQIGGALGEGGAEMVGYLRYQLQYQQALDKLAAVRDKVAQARQAGFIPAALQAELEAAEAEADAAKDKLDWQKEYRSVQEESVDLQLQLVKALEKLAGALDKVGGIDTTGVKTGEGTGSLPTLETPFVSNLPTSAPFEFEIEGGEELQGVLDGVSADFESMRGKIEKWLTLPVEDKIRDILKELGKVTGVDFAGLFDRLREFDLGESISALLTTGLDALRKNGPQWARNVGKGLLDLLLRGLASLGLTNALLRLKIGDVLLGLIRQFLNALAQNGATWGQSIGSAIGTVWGLAFTFFTQTLPEWREKIRAFPVQLIQAVAEWVVENGPTYARQWADAVKDYIVKWIDIIKTEGPGWAKGLSDFAKEYLIAFAVAFVENAPDGLKETVRVGVEFVNKVKQGIDTAWDMLTYARDKITQWVASVLLFLGTWVARLSEAGATVVGKLKSGINTAWDLLSWIGGKFLTLVKNLTEGAGDTFQGLVNLGKAIVEKIKGGVNEQWDLPSWMSGLLIALWDALLTGSHSGWLNKVFGAGSAIVDNLKRGILNAWNSFRDWWRSLLDDLTKPLPGSEPKDTRSPLRGLGKRGAALVENFSRGIDFSNLQRKLSGELLGVQRALATATPLGTGISVYVDGGLNFPGVRSGRDVDNFTNALRRRALEATMSAKA